MTFEVQFKLKNSTNLSSMGVEEHPLLKKYTTVHTKTTCMRIFMQAYISLVQTSNNTLRRLLNRRVNLTFVQQEMSNIMHLYSLKVRTINFENWLLHTDQIVHFPKLPTQNSRNKPNHILEKLLISSIKYKEYSKHFTE